MDILAPAADVGMEEVIEAKVDRPSAEEPAPAQPAPDTEMAIEAKQGEPRP